MNGYWIEIRQLQHFILVAEELRFTRAARRVNIVQSALSTSIVTLEKERIATLFARSTRDVRLTTAGEVFLDKARSVLETVREARSNVAAVQGLKRGTLMIGAVQSLPAFLDLALLLARFQERHPGIEIRLVQRSSANLPIGRGRGRPMRRTGRRSGWHGRNRPSFAGNAWWPICPWRQRRALPG